MVTPKISNRPFLIDTEYLLNCVTTLASNVFHANPTPAVIKRISVVHLQVHDKHR